MRPDLRLALDEPASDFSEETRASWDATFAVIDRLPEDERTGAFMQAQVAEARKKGIRLFVVWTEPELDEWDRGSLVDTYVRRHFLQQRRYPNWTGPKDMTATSTAKPPAIQLLHRVGRAEKRRSSISARQLLGSKRR